MKETRSLVPLSWGWSVGPLRDDSGFQTDEFSEKFQTNWLDKLKEYFRRNERRRQEFLKIPERRKDDCVFVLPTPE